MRRAILFIIFFFNIANTSFCTIPEKVIICGVCRDVGSKLPYSIQIAEDIGDLFEDYRIIIYENNSSDNTPNILAEWTENNSRVTAISEMVTEDELKRSIINVNKDGSFFRPELIARSRNIVLELALQERYSEFSYIIWMDMDFVRAPDLSGISEAFASELEWDAIFAYGIDPNNSFWDWYAFRDARHPLGSELMGDAWWYRQKKLTLNENDPWYPVYSAFGGCGIYKKSSIIGCKYSAIVTKELGVLANTIIQKEKRNGHKQVLKYVKGLKKLKSIVNIKSPKPGLPKFTNTKIGFTIDGCPISPIWKMSTFVYQYPSVCEHVPFHASMILNGHDKLFINPRLIFRY